MVKLQIQAIIWAFLAAGFFGASNWLAGYLAQLGAAKYMSLAVWYLTISTWELYGAFHLCCCN